MSNAAPSSDSGQVYRLIHRSRNRILPDRRKAGLGELFSQNRSNNKAKHLTGALLVSGDWSISAALVKSHPISICRLVTLLSCGTDVSVPLRRAVRHDPGSPGWLAG